MFFVGLGECLVPQNINGRRMGSGTVGNYTLFQFFFSLFKGKGKNNGTVPQFKGLSIKTHEPQHPLKQNPYYSAQQLTPKSIL